MKRVISNNRTKQYIIKTHTVQCWIELVTALISLTISEIKIRIFIFI